MPDRVPSFFMLVPGQWRDHSEVLRVLQGKGIDALPRGDSSAAADEVLVDVIHDERLASGFTWGRNGPLPKELVQQVDECGRAALIEVGQRLDENPALVARLGRALKDAGGIAVRMEASGSASTWDTWL